MITYPYDQCTHGPHVTMDHVMPKEKRCGALDSCFGLVGPAKHAATSLSGITSLYYKGKVERSTCGFEFIPTRLCSGTALVVLKKNTKVQTLGELRMHGTAN